MLGRQTICVVPTNAAQLMLVGQSVAARQFLTQKLPPGKVEQLAPNPQAEGWVGSHCRVQLGTGKSSSCQHCCPVGQVAVGLEQSSSR